MLFWVPSMGIVFWEFLFGSCFAFSLPFDIAFLILPLPFPSHIFFSSLSILTIWGGSSSHNGSVSSFCNKLMEFCFYVFLFVPIFFVLLIGAILPLPIMVVSSSRNTLSIFCFCLSFLSHSSINLYLNIFLPHWF